MTSDNKKYQGWANYETWCVNLWLNNDESTYHYVQELVNRAKDKYDAARAIKEAVEEMNPLAGQASVYSDLMTATLGEVNWEEIAEGFLEVQDE